MSMGIFKNLIGIKFGRLLVHSRQGVASNGGAKWLCICECGSSTITTSTSLTSGRTKSCGCLQRDINISRLTKHGQCTTNKKHPLYATWNSMRSRCNNKNSGSYHKYGGRGIKICPEWEDFETFVLDMGNRPNWFSIDRIDNDKGYSKDNCRWADIKTQANNTRHNRLILYKGVEYTISELATKYGFESSTLRHRLNKGYDVSLCVETPINKLKAKICG